jgi:hypothetical protein
VTLSAERANIVRATLHRLVLALRADDRFMRADEVIERLTALGCTVSISETHVTLTLADDDGDPIEVVAPRRHTMWLLTLQACMSNLIERTTKLEA